MTAYDRGANDPDFRTRGDEAIEVFTDELVESSLQARHRGLGEPVFHEGAECGVKRKFDHMLAIFFMKVRRPREMHDAFVLARELDDAGCPPTWCRR